MQLQDLLNGVDLAPQLMPLVVLGILEAVKRAKRQRAQLLAHLERM